MILTIKMEFKEIVFRIAIEICGDRVVKATWQWNKVANYLGYRVNNTPSNLTVDQFVKW